MEVGSYWNGWEIVEQLGEGSFGKVFKIVKKEFDHEYVSALKVLRVPQSEAQYEALVSEMGSEKSVQDYFYTLIKGFANECALMAKLTGHTNIVSYYDHVIEQNKDGFGWTIYIRMEYLKSIQDYFGGADLTQADVINLSISICRAMEVYSQYSIIHRDIKPGNVLISELGDYKLADFGVARIAENANTAMSKKGTYNFMAPEVYKMQPYDITADIYSLGIMMYRYLNHNRMPLLPPYPEPIDFQDMETANIERLTGKPLNRPQEASDELSAIILKACAYDPRERYQHPTDMLKDLEEAALHLISLSMGQTYDGSISPAAESSQTNEEPSVPAGHQAVVERAEEEQSSEADYSDSGRNGVQDSASHDHEEAAVPSDGNESHSQDIAMHEALDVKKVVSERLAVGDFFYVYLRDDGTVVSKGRIKLDARDWHDLTAIAAGPDHVIGVRADGKVVYSKIFYGLDYRKRDNIDSWQDIIAVAAGKAFSVGLKADGHVVIDGNTLSGREKVRTWEDITAISASDDHILGLKKDGTVVAAGPTSRGRCDVNDWKDIVAVSAGTKHSLGLKRDGTVVATGSSSDPWKKADRWQNIIGIAAGYHHSLGLKKDGTVVGISNSNRYSVYKSMMGIEQWHDIVGIAAGTYSIGLMSDGTIVEVGVGNKLD